MPTENKAPRVAINARATSKKQFTTREEQGAKKKEPQEQPGFALLSKFLAERKTDYVFMDHPYRLSDDEQEVAEIIHEIEETGVRIEFTATDRSGLAKKCCHPKRPQ